jgi:hypothetical protein
MNIGKMGFRLQNGDMSKKSQVLYNIKEFEQLISAYDGDTGVELQSLLKAVEGLIEEHGSDALLVCALWNTYDGEDWIITKKNV